MTLLIKDANTQTQPLSTQVDAAANLVPVHAPASVAGGVATPVSAASPLPVINTAGAVAVDGSGTVAAGGTAQTLFTGATPSNGFLVANLDATHTLYVSDVGVASAAGTAVPVAPNTVFATPAGYRPAGPVSLFSATTGHAFAARRW